MIEWLTVISLIVVGVVLIILEIIFVPGTTIVGILGILAIAGGVYLGFDYFGPVTGGWILGVGLVSGLAALIGALRSRAWEKFSLKTTNEGKFNEGLVDELKVDDEGITISTLRPIGKAEFKDREYEVKTMGNYLVTGTPVKIIRIESNNIYVEPINKE